MIFFLKYVHHHRSTTSISICAQPQGECKPPKNGHHNSNTSRVRVTVGIKRHGMSERVVFCGLCRHQGECNDRLLPCVT